MSQIMKPDFAQPGCLTGGRPPPMAEPVSRDMPVGVPGARRAGAVPAAGPAAGTIVGVRAAAVLAPASRRVVGGEGSVPVLASFLVRFRHSRHRHRIRVVAPGPALCRWPVREDQVVAAEALRGDVGLDLGGDLAAELEPPVFLVLSGSP